MKQLNFIFLTAISLLIFSSCNKDEDTLAPIPEVIYTGELEYELYDTSLILSGTELNQGLTGYWDIIEKTDSCTLSDVENPNCLFTGNLAGEYLLRWTVTNGSEEKFSDISIKIIGFIDSRDSLKYKVVRIGSQIWMAENLKAIKYNDGEQIPLVTDGAEWINKYTPAYCWYDNDSSLYAQTFGAIYNWYTVNTEKLSPIGWHIPSDDEWNEMVEYLGGDSIAGSKLKETGNLHWTDSNIDATNETGFSALPGGYRATDGNFYHIGLKEHWWTSTLFSSTHSVKIDINGENGIVNSGNGNKIGGVSIRCILD